MFLTYCCLTFVSVFLIACQDTAKHLIATKFDSFIISKTTGRYVRSVMYLRYPTRLMTELYNSCITC